MSKVNEAVECFTAGFSCSQAVFSTYAPELGLTREMALRIAGSFGGGIGQMAETCGAVTGAYMAIGLKYATAELNTEAKEETYAKVQEFAKKFKESNKTDICSELLGCNISTEEGKQVFKEKQLRTVLCANYVRNASQILEEIL